MRVDNGAFADINKSQWQAPQFVVTVDFGDDDLFYLTSHSVTGLSGENVIEGVLVSISGTSQKLNPDKANSEIGSIKFEALDDGLTRLQAEWLGNGKGLRGKTVQFFVGDECLEWSEFVLATTQIIDEASYKDLAYSFKCADVQRMLREDVFKRKETRLNRTLEASSNEIEVLTTSGFEPYQHPDVDGAEVGGQKVGLLHIEGDDDSFEIASYTGKEPNKFTGVTRGLFGTTPLRVERSKTDDSESSPKVTEFIYFEMPGPMLAYAVLTGSVHGHPGEYLPEHWNLGVPPELIRTSDFESIGADLWIPDDPNKGLVVRLAGLEEQDGKKFLEEQVFLLMGCYPPVYSDGQLGIRRMTPVHSTGGYVRRLDADNVVDYGDLTHDMGAVIDEIFVSWNWDLFQEEYTRLSYLPDLESIQIHGKSEQKELEFRGLYSNRHSYQTIQRLVASLRDRYAGPPLRLSLTLTPDQNDLEVGDIVRVDLLEVQDYTGTTEDGHLNRNFEIQQISTDWRTGKVKVKLFGSSKKAGALPPQETGTAIPDEWYERGTEIGPASFPGVVTVSGGVTRVEGVLDLVGGESLGDEASFYWCATDLNCDDEAEIRIADNVVLLVRGFFALNNAKINGKGRGYAGGSGTNSMKVGGYFFEYGSRWAPENLGTPGFIDIQSTPQGGRGYQNRGSLEPYVLDVDGVATMRNEGAIIGGYIQPGQTPPPVYEQDETGVRLFPVDLRGSSGSGGGSVISNYEGYLEYETPGGDGGAGGAGLVIISRGMSIGVSGYIDVSGAAGNTPSGTYYRPSADPQLHIWAGSGGPGGPGACYILVDGTANPPSINERTAKANGGDLVWAGRRLKPYKVFHSSVATISSDKGPAPQQGTATTSPAPGAMVWETAFTVQTLTGYIAPVEDEPVVTLNPPDVTLAEATNTPRTANANLSTIEVAVQPPSASNYAYGLVEYREKGQSGWFEVGPASPEATFVVPSDGCTYEVQVRGVSRRGKVNQDGTIAEITTTKVRTPGDEPGEGEDADTPETPPAEVVPAPPVTGLELFEQGNDTVFGGRDAKFVWRKTSVTEWFEMGGEGVQGAGAGGLDLYFKDYQVEIWAEVNGLPHLMRTEWVNDPEFVYTGEKNAEDHARETGAGGAWREFELRVYCRGRQNQISERPARLAVSNPPPALPDGITITPSLRSVAVEFKAPEDLDYRHTCVWLSAASGFTPSDNTLAAQVDGSVALQGLTDGTTYYIRLASYDAFGQGEMSPEFSVTTQTIQTGDVDGLQDEIGDLQNAIGEKGDILFQATEPEAAYQNDSALWVDTSLDSNDNPKNMPKRWDGTAWVAVSDQEIKDAAAEAYQAAQDAQDLAAGKSRVLVQATTPAAEYENNKTLWIDTTNGANTPKHWEGTEWVSIQDGDIAQAKTDISDIKVKKTIALDADGNITGVENIDGTDAGQFNILSSDFNIVDPGDPGGTPLVPFTVTGGTVYANNLMITHTNLEDGSVDLAGPAITGQLAGDNIQDGAIVNITEATSSPNTQIFDGTDNDTWKEVADLDVFVLGNGSALAPQFHFSFDLDQVTEAAGQAGPGGPMVEMRLVRTDGVSDLIVWNPDPLMVSGSGRVALQFGAKIDTGMAAGSQTYRVEVKWSKGVYDAGTVDYPVNWNSEGEAVLQSGLTPITWNGAYPTTYMGDGWDLTLEGTGMDPYTLVGRPFMKVSAGSAPVFVEGWSGSNTYVLASGKYYDPPIPFSVRLPSLDDINKASTTETLTNQPYSAENARHKVVGSLTYYWIRALEYRG